jgi:OMF family outer membrane factor
MGKALVAPRLTSWLALVGAGLLPLAAVPGLAAVPAPASSNKGTTTVPLTPTASLDPAPQPLPLATQVKGTRPKSNPSVLAPAATKLTPDLLRLSSPASLALPTTPNQVSIRALRPLGLGEVENLAEVNNPNLKVIATQVDEAKSNLRAQLAAWYPTLSMSASSFPSFTNSESYASLPDGTFNRGSTGVNQVSSRGITAGLSVNWALINPQRVPQIAAARDQFEQAKNQYLIALRELRLQAAQAYFQLQLSDDQVRIGQESVRASLVSLRDARARFQAGVATKLEVLQAETQLGRDEQLLTNSIASQSIARRSLARLLDLPQTVTPTAKEPLRVLGIWTPSLQESIVAAYAFREELDNSILDISVANSNANAARGAVQPFLNIFESLTASRNSGGTISSFSPALSSYGDGSFNYNVSNSVGLGLTWSIFDGGKALAQSRQYKQKAAENAFKFADQRDTIRFQVEQSFYQLRQHNRDIQTTSREVISARESLRLARLRYQAGVTTQREVVDTQRDLTQAEVAYATALANYNTSLAELRRRTGLDQVAVCQPPNLPAVKPDSGIKVPVPPEPLQPACQANLRRLGQS